MGVNLCRFGLCLVGALYQVAAATLGGLWPDVPTNHIPAPSMPVWTQSNRPHWCQTPAHTHTHTQPELTHCSQLHFQTWITTELTLCDPLPKQKDAPLCIQTHIYTTNTHTHKGLVGWSYLWLDFKCIIPSLCLSASVLPATCKDKSSVLSHSITAIQVVTPL